MRRFFIALLAVVATGLWLAPPAVLAGEGDQIRMIFRQPGDFRWTYPLQVLRTAMERTEEDFGPWELNGTAIKLSRDRALQLLETGELINVHIAPTRREWEERALPIRIPIRKGLLGYRLLLIHRQDQVRFAALTTVEQLKQLSAGLHPQWTTTKAMQQLGFKIIEGSSYPGLFSMLQARRFDYFPRGVNEVFEELQTHQQLLPDLYLEPSKAIYLPLPTYFFVSPAYPGLAKRIRTGLERMLADGSFDRLFNQYHGEHLRKARLEQRQIFYLHNPLLPAETPFADQRLWLDSIVQQQSRPPNEVH